MQRLDNGRENRLSSPIEYGEGRKMSKKRFADVSEMIDSVSDDSSFNEEIQKRIASRQIIKSLVAMRASQGVSQSAIADELGCTQSRISKIENGFDDDLSLRDFSAYARVLGREVHIHCPKRGEGLVDRVKYHAFQMRDALLSLVKLAHRDDKIVEGVAKLHVEAFLNIMHFLQETSSKLPPCPDSGQPYIRIVSCESEDDASESPGDERSSQKEGSVPFEAALS